MDWIFIEEILVIEKKMLALLGKFSSDPLGAQMEVQEFMTKDAKGV
ncbi:MAG: hypothetical protein WA705_20405 [Candidatus Ozemobacteraceae bacterium]